VEGNDPEELEMTRTVARDADEEVQGGRAGRPNWPVRPSGL